jgi:hypothetical protein
MLELGLACDGGKDSLSMAASAGGETVMAPGNLVVSAYVGCPDITLTVRCDTTSYTITATELMSVTIEVGQHQGTSC